MKFTKRYNFIKERENVPILDQEKKVIDPKAGGIKIEYAVYATENIHMRIGKRDIYIPFWKYNKQTLVFLKPLKSMWDQGRYKISKNHQGKPKSVFTNLWVILENKKGSTNCYDDLVEWKKDYQDVRPKTLCIKKEHHPIVKYLDLKKDRFSVPYVQIFY